VAALATTFGGMCCRRSIAVVRVFAIVMACRIFIFVTRLSGYAKTVTPSALAGPGCRDLSWWLQSIPGPKAVAYTDLLC